MQIQQFEIRKLQNSIAVKLIFWGWMLAVIFVYFVWFGPHEFWLVAEKLGVANELARFEAWLIPFFTANYLS